MDPDQDEDCSRRASGRASGRDPDADLDADSGSRASASASAFCQEPSGNASNSGHSMPSPSASHGGFSGSRANNSGDLLAPLVMRLNAFHVDPNPNPLTAAFDSIVSRGSDLSATPTP